MNAFKISVIFFIFLIAIIISNMFFIKSTEETLLKMIKEIEVTDSITNNENRKKTIDSISDLQKYWQDQKDLVAISVSYTQISRISELIQSLRSYYESDEIGEYQNTKELLKLTINQIGKQEQFLWSNIF